MSVKIYRHDLCGRCWSERERPQQCGDCAAKGFSREMCYVLDYAMPAAIDLARQLHRELGWLEDEIAAAVRTEAQR